MNWEKLGKEFQMIGRIAEKSGSEQPAEPRVKILQAIGDDTAILSIEEPAQLLWTTDMLVEGIHFRLDLVDPYRLGWKSLAVNLSDLAAMGGHPVGTLLSVALPEERTSDWWDHFSEGFLACARTYQTPLLGGDTNRHTHVILDVSVLGTVSENAVKRDGAAAGDKLFVTGSLGGSRAGLQRLLAEGLTAAEEHDPEAVEAHLRPLPRLLEGLTAAGSGISAMMDISDGLAGDLQKMCAASGLGAVLKLNDIPVHPAVKRWLSDGREIKRFALEGGEDYELLMAVPAKSTSRLIQAFEWAAETPLTEVGYLTAASEIWLEEDEDHCVPLQGGWDHFGG